MTEADEKLVKGLKSLITKAFWRGMWVSTAFAIGISYFFDGLANGFTPLLVLLIGVLFFISLIEFLAYLGLHQKIERIRSLPAD